MDQRPAKFWQESSRGKVKKISIISLGCPKNLVDSEVMEALLMERDYDIVNSSEKSEIIVINTCTFIDDAKEESVDEIFRAIELKRIGQCDFIIVSGCMPQRYGSILEKELPEVDLFIGTGEVPRIAQHVMELVDNGRLYSKTIIKNPDFLMNSYCPRMISTPAPYAYIKIAEGCSNCCSYCVIPSVRGKFRSRRVDDVLREAEILAAKGVKELVLAAQETTCYGADLPDKPDISILMRELCSIKDLRWIRLLYTYPSHLSDKLFETMADHDKICKYLDIPVQHIDDDILKSMGRKGDSGLILDAIKRARANMPEIVLRTSLIVGYPGETARQFNRLHDFVVKTRFDHLGVFTYSKEEGTRAAEMPNQVSARIKESRKKKIMEEQGVISLEKNMCLIGSVQEMIIQEESDLSEYSFIGRIRGQAPDIDGITYIKAPPLGIGEIINCRITGADMYDLFAEVI
jgi:ribosomal protein S12 methylthiotransferase